MGGIVSDLEGSRGKRRDKLLQDACGQGRTKIVCFVLRLRAIKAVW